MCSAYEQLIGIPWGYGPPPESADCFSLAIYAQEMLFGHKIDVPSLGDPSWNRAMLKEKSHEIQEALPKFADKVKEQEKGDLVLFTVGGYTHLATLIDKWHMLHIFIDKKSRVSRLSGWPIDSFWRVRRV
jgi:cell wall-associated NlpC family hydrolase